MWEYQNELHQSLSCAGTALGTPHAFCLIPAILLSSTTDEEAGAGSVVEWLRVGAVSRLDMELNPSFLWPLGILLDLYSSLPSSRKMEMKLCREGS